MKYDRLTQWTASGASLILDNPRNDYEAKQMVMTQFKEACNKLAELEDKIESGMLIELPLNGTTENMSEFAIGFFIKHNAEVRKQAVREFAEALKAYANNC